MKINSVAAVIVTFNPGNIYLENFLTIVNQVDKIIIVDNKSDEETQHILQHIEKTYLNIIVIYNKENLGLAKAQNIGIAEAIKFNLEWILLLDDDSKAAPNMVQTMLDFFNNYHESNKLAIISPHIKETMIEDESFYYTINNNFFNLRKKFESKLYLEVFFTIASGSLIKTDLYKKIGKFREDFFIDYIDIEYGLRTNLAGYKIIALRDAILYHRLGNKRTHKFLNFSATSFNHNALRKYYIYRNRIRVWKLYITKFPTFIMYDIMSAYWHILKIIFLEKNKLNKIFSIFKGIKDGFFERIN